MLRKPMGTLSLSAVSLLMIAGCGSDDDEPIVAPPITAASSAASGTAESSPSTEHSPSRQQPSGPLRAEDGTDLGACRDGTCEVIVQSGDEISFEPEVRVSSLTVESVTGEEISWVVLGEGAASTSTGGVGGKGHVNELNYTVVAIRDGRAVLWLTRD